MYRTSTTPLSLQLKPKFEPSRRQRGGVAALLFFLAACGEPPPNVGEIGAIKGFSGVAISEEPRAALAAQEILSIGGTAADAAATAFFVMTVTYPVAVGLGGGGICLYYDHRSNKTETLDFRVGKAAAGGRIAIPGSLRGIALLHGRYGVLPWSKLVAPAEVIARFGHQMSRALADRLRPQTNRLAADQLARRIFLGAKGRSLSESETIVQVELASVLTRIRTLGVGDLYGGEAGRRFVKAAADSGGRITISDMREYRAVWRGTRQTPLGNHILHHPDLGESSNRGQRITNLIIKSSPKKFERNNLVIGKNLTVGDEGQAGLVISDSLGSTAACVFDMVGAFGVASVIPEFGIFLTNPGIGNIGGLALLGINEHVAQTVMAVSGAGGLDGAFAAATVAVGVMKNRQVLDITMAEQTHAKARVQGLWCPKGVRQTPESCQFVTDEKGHGLAVFAKF